MSTNASKRLAFHSTNEPRHTRRGFAVGHHVRRGAARRRPLRGRDREARVRPGDLAFLGPRDEHRVETRKVDLKRDRVLPAGRARHAHAHGRADGGCDCADRRDEIDRRRLERGVGVGRRGEKVLRQSGRVETAHQRDEDVEPREAVTG